MFCICTQRYKCHLPYVINDEFTNDIMEEIDKFNNLRSLLDENVNDIRKIPDNLKRQKEYIMKIITKCFEDNGYK